jgi:hypothetical protein
MIFMASFDELLDILHCAVWCIYAFIIRNIVALTLWCVS